MHIDARNLNPGWQIAFEVTAINPACRHIEKCRVILRELRIAATNRWFAHGKFRFLPITQA